MLRLKKVRPAVVAVMAKAFPDAANVAAGALVFGQALSGQAYSAGLALLGLCVWVLFLAFAIVLSSLEDKP